MLRRALFQLHLWMGIGLGLYVFVISLSGSAIVLRREMDRLVCPGPVVVSPSGELVRTATCEPAFVTWIAELHDHLGAGRTGLLVNGVGATMVVLMGVTGGVIWWPRRGRWWRSMSVRSGVGGYRLLRDLHSMLGFWLFLLIVLWAVTGIYFAFPGAFSLLSDDLIAWAVRLHFGRAFGLFVKVTWVLLGLVPCALFITGAWMWWSRVLRKALQKSRSGVHSEDFDPVEREGLRVTR
jgi:uncharacterized iron-regulated membrane protein